jgi:hypothetical protein
VRAPDQDFVAYSDEEWQEIKSSLAAFVDADTVMIGERRLRDELSGIAADWIAVSHGDFPTSKQRADRLGKALKAIETLRGKLNFHLLGRVAKSDAARAAHEVLTALADEVQTQRDALATAGSRSSTNAAQAMRNLYLGQLERLWKKAIVSAATRRLLRKEKAGFLLACASPPFPTTTESAIENYLDRRPQTRA